MDHQDENSLPAQQGGKKPLAQSAKDFMAGVLSPLKGRDVSQLVEDFTAEMTLVAEGLSEDQARLAQEQDKLSAQQTELEQQLLDRLHDAEVTAGEMRKEIDALAARLEKAEKTAREKKLKKVEGFTGLLRQATWLAAILGGAWVLTTIINLFK